VRQHRPDVPPLVRRCDTYPSQKATTVLLFPLLGDAAENESDDSAVRVEVPRPTFPSRKDPRGRSFKHFFGYETQLSVTVKIFDNFKRVPSPIKLWERIGVEDLFP
jgi:hypothetical protein